MNDIDDKIITAKRRLRQLQLLRESSDGPKTIPQPCPMCSKIGIGEHAEYCELGKFIDASDRLNAVLDRTISTQMISLYFLAIDAIKEECDREGPLAEQTLAEIRRIIDLTLRRVV